MKSVWIPAHHLELRQRVRVLTPQHAARWGRFTAPQMVAHLCDSLRMASGELDVTSRKALIRHTPLKQLIIYCMPLPRNVPTAPELLTRTPGDFPEDLAELEQRLDALVKAGPSAVVPAHPAFGRLTGRQWGVLVYRHMHHHLSQFGV